MKISIICPSYEFYGRGAELLGDLFKTIKTQTYKNFEVIVPDHSTGDIIENEIKKWKGIFDIRYFKNEKGRGNSSINMNEGIKKANGDIIKVMHIDDMFCNDKTLELIVNGLKNNPDKKWGYCTFHHYDEGAKVFKNKLSTFGCPSTFFYIQDKDESILFDENLIYVNDGEMCNRLQKKYGKPIDIKELCVTIRLHADQVTNKLITKDIIQKEKKYFNKIKNE